MLKIVRSVLARISPWEEVQLVVVVCWTLIPALATLVGFYLGTIFAGQHVQDLQPKDMAVGARWALILLGAAILNAVFVTATYPRIRARDLAAEHEAH